MRTALIPYLALLLAAPPLAAQGLRVDGSTGVPAQTLLGPHYQIGEQLGRRAGGNLFHSFQYFDLQAGESATFSVLSSGIANVISRVSGGAPSLIYGSLRLQAAEGRPALFFINPAGLLFGDGASIDVPGAFHASTADYLRLTDGSRWESSGGSSFNAAAPEAFGFVGGGAAPILLSAASLAGATQQALSLSAGDLQIDASQLLSSGGLRLAAVGSQAAELGLQAALPADLDGFIGVAQGSRLVLRAEGAQSPERFEIAGGDMWLADGALLATLTRLSSSSDAGPLQIRLGGSLFMDGGSAIQSIAATAARGGAIELQAGQISLVDDASIWTYSEAAGQAGSLDLQARQALWMRSGANLYSSSYAAGDGGLLRVRAPLISLDSGAFIGSDALAGGRSGAIDVAASQALLLQAASVFAQQQGSGDGGALCLDGGALLHLSDGARVSAAALGSGTSGLLELRGQQLLLDNGAAVRHSADGLAGSGDTRLLGEQLLRLQDGADVRMLQLGPGGSGQLLLQGGTLELLSGAGVGNNAAGVGARAGSIELRAGSGLLLADAGVSSLGLDGAHAGDVLLTGGDILLRGASFVTGSAGDEGGAAGALRLLANGRITMQDQALLSASTASSANAGSIQLQAARIELQGEARINAVTSAAGRGGAIELSASDSLWVAGSAGLLSSTAGPGSGGRMLLRAPELRITDQALLFANSAGLLGGDGGAIRLEAGRLLEIGGHALLDSSTFSASGRGGQIALISGGDLRLLASNGPGVSVAALAAEGTNGQAGSLLLQAAGSLELGAGSRVGSASLGSGDGGSIRLQAARIDLSGASLSSSSYGEGRAGDIEVQGGEILLRDGSGLFAFAGPQSAGRSGDILLQAEGAMRIEGQSLVSISNEARQADPAGQRAGLLRLQAPRIAIEQSGLSAAASGNADAGRIELRAGEQLLLRDSAASTTAQDGNGGSLLTETGGLLWLQRAGLLTSVLGASGNGGDIVLNARALLLDGGFIQANTAAADASGGNVRVAINALVARDNRVAIGGDAALVYDALRPLNVIQAAAPDGVSGVVAVSNTIDLGGSLALLERDLLAAGALGRSPCERSAGSGLMLLGRGGLPGTAVWRPAPAGSAREQPGGGCR